MRVTDIHAHYYDAKYESTDGGAEEILSAPAFKDTVGAVINAGTTPENSRICIQLAKKYDFMYAAAGVHPEDCGHLEGTPEELAGEIRKILDGGIAEQKIVAVGEIGLDYYWQPFDKERQQRVFDLQMDLAREYSLPVEIHDRDAHGDCFETVLRHPGVIGAFHAYSGSAEMARELVKRGWYISFGGTVTFKNAERVRAVAASVPLDRILTETDCPYLAPVPHRGEINRSDYIPLIIQVLAGLHGKTEDEMTEITSENAKRLFKMP